MVGREGLPTFENNYYIYNGKPRNFECIPKYHISQFITIQYNILLNGCFTRIAPENH